MGRSHSEALSAVVASANFEAKMNLLFQPWYLLLALLSEWVRQQQEEVYLSSGFHQPSGGSVIPHSGRELEAQPGDFTGASKAKAT